MSEHKSRIAIKDVPQLLDEFEQYVENAYFDKNLLPDTESPIPGSSLARTERSTWARNITMRPTPQSLPAALLKSSRHWKPQEALLKNG